MSDAVLKPALAFCSVRKLRTNSDAPTSSTSDSAISATTSALRSRFFRTPEPLPRAPSRSASCRLPRAACSAGASPNRMPVTIEMTTVYTSVGRSIAQSM